MNYNRITDFKTFSKAVFCGVVKFNEYCLKSNAREGTQRRLLATIPPNTCVSVTGRARTIDRRNRHRKMRDFWDSL